MIPPGIHAPRLGRRAALWQGVATTLAAARLLGPAVFVGCSSGVPPRQKTVTVGLLHSQTGTTAVGGRSLRYIETHAFERINAAGGILGRQVELVAPNPRSRAELRLMKTRQMLDEGAAAVFGCWTSASRKSVLPLFEEYKRLLLYAVQYEGNESSPYCVYGGMVPNQQILPLLDWLTSPAGGEKKRIFLVGSDYVYPRTANFIAKKYLQTKGLGPVGEEYVPLGSRDFAAVVKKIREAPADCVVNTVNGDSNLGFFAALAECHECLAKLVGTLKTRGGFMGLAEPGMEGVQE